MKYPDYCLLPLFDHDNALMVSNSKSNTYEDHMLYYFYTNGILSPSSSMMIPDVEEAKIIGVDGGDIYQSMNLVGESSKVSSSSTSRRPFLRRLSSLFCFYPITYAYT